MSQTASNEKQMVKIKIDGKEFTVERGTPILKVANDNGIRIPHLCHHPQVSTYGVCRICLVEVYDGRKTRITASCTYPALEGIEVMTNSEKIVHHRKVIMELILARNYRNPDIHKLAAELGVYDTRFEKGDKDCYLCGLCVRTCEEIVGVNALGFIDRGPNREVGVPLDRPSDVCIGCGACAIVCPAQCIPMKEEGNVRTIWGRDFELVDSDKFGGQKITKAALEYFVKSSSVPEDFF